VSKETQRWWGWCLKEEEENYDAENAFELRASVRG
jgi:hypothetical protein